MARRTVIFDDEKWQLVPKIPTLDMIDVMRNSKWPEDLEVGKAVQRHHGFEVVPPETNTEFAVGQYLRLLSTAPGHN